MAPVTDVGADLRTGLVELHRQTARDEVGSGSETDRTAADDGDRQRFER
jgi:hypothetical protein